jgi:hypothetical protein
MWPSAAKCPELRFQFLTQHWSAGRRESSDRLFGWCYIPCKPHAFRATRAVREPSACLLEGASSMNASFNKASFAAAATLAVLVLTNVADAAVSLGYPPGRPYYGSSNQQSGMRSYRSYAPSYSTADETRQSYSYEPSEDGSADGAAQNGCCCSGGHASKGDANDHVAAKPEETRQSYSYEPAAEPAPQYRSNGRRTASVGAPWQYQRTDPRRRGN